MSENAEEEGDGVEKATALHGILGKASVLDLIFEAEKCLTFYYRENANLRSIGTLILREGTRFPSFIIEGSKEEVPIYPHLPTFIILKDPTEGSKAYLKIDCSISEDSGGGLVHHLRCTAMRDGMGYEYEEDLYSVASLVGYGGVLVGGTDSDLRSEAWRAFSSEPGAASSAGGYNVDLDQRAIAESPFHFPRENTTRLCLEETFREPAATPEDALRWAAFVPGTGANSEGKTLL